MGKKRGQVAVFIILFLVLVGMVALTLYAYSYKQAAAHNQRQSVISELQLFPPEKFVTHCAQRTIVRLLENASLNGGLINPQDSQLWENLTKKSLSYTTFDKKKYLYHYTTSSANQLIDSQFIQRQIDMYLPDLLDECLDESLYAKQGYEVTSGDITTKTIIRNDQVFVTVDYPLSLTKGQSTLTFKDFTVNVDISFGRLVDAVREIVYANQHGVFDAQEFMHRTENIEDGRPLITIHTIRPYPNELHEATLKQKDVTFTFQFAVQGTSSFDTNSLNALQVDVSQQYGCCTLPSGACFVQTTSQLCLASLGTYTDDLSCDCQEDNTYFRLKERQPSLFDYESETIQEQATDFAQSIQDTEFLNCGDRKSGESWCDSQFGVGSRHARVLCIDGQTQREYCKDYREQICVQDEFDGLQQSRCVTNAALTCVQCTSESCCLASDCIWEDNTCHGAIPAGIPHWNIGYAKDICQGIARNAASESTCPLTADCAASFTVFGDQSDPAKPEEYYNKLVDSFQAGRESVQYQTPIHQAQIVPPSDYRQSFTQLLDDAINALEDFAQYTPAEYLDPQIPVNAEGLRVSCLPFSPPLVDEQTCAYCMTYGEGCSEYVCKSLGSNCRLITRSSEQICTADSEPRSPATITALTADANQIQRTTLGDLNGYSLTQPVSASELTTIKFSTSQAALCKPTYLPFNQFGSIKSLDLSNGTYSTQHEFRIRFMNDLPVFDALLFRFVVPDYQTLVGSITEFVYKLEQLHERYPFVEKYDPPFFPWLRTVVESYSQPTHRVVLDSLLSDLTRKKFSIFFVCEDDAGQESVPTFISFNIKSSCTDRRPIQILGASFDQDQLYSDTVYTYTVTPATCKYDITPTTYSSMRFNMSCENTVASDRFDGSYPCTAKVQDDLQSKGELSDDISKIYVMCEPFVSDDTTFFIPLVQAVDTNNSNVTKINLSQSNSQAIVFTNASGSSFNVVFAEPYDCSVTTAARKVPLACSLTSCRAKDIKLEPQSQLICKPRSAFGTCDVSPVLPMTAPYEVTLVKATPFMLKSFEYVQQRIEMVIQARTQEDLRCYLTIDGEQQTFTQVNDATFVIDTPELELNTLARVTCEDAYGSAYSAVKLIG
ncbi:MAG TPA: hypothetical protein VK158_05405 [Acidobacteriota bacterium]|nr:hypothetical protein [Acidobacteriota bacterium]